MKKTIVILVSLTLVFTLVGCMKKPVKPNLSVNGNNQSVAENDGGSPVSSRSGKGINLVSSAKSLYGGILKAFGKIGKNGKPVEFKKKDLVTAMIIAGAALVALLVFAQNRPRKYSPLKASKSPGGKYRV